MSATLNDSKAAEHGMVRRKENALVRECNGRFHPKPWCAVTLIALMFFMMPGLYALADDAKVILLPDAKAAQPDVAPASTAPSNTADELQAVRASYNRHLVKMSLRKAIEYAQQGDYARAKAEYEWVLSVDPENEQANRALPVVAKKAPSQQVIQTVVNEADEIIRRNRLEMEFRYYEANRLIAEGNYIEAIPKLQMAVAIGQSVGGVDRLLADATALLQKAEAHKNTQMSEEARAQRREAESLVKLYEQKRRERSIEKARTLFDQAKKNYERREFKPALDQVNEVLKLDDSYRGAKTLKMKIESDGKKAIEKAIAEEKERSHEREFAKIEEWRRPQTELLLYPDEPRRHEPLEIKLPGADADGPSIAAIKNALGKKISCTFTDVPLSEAIKHLRDTTGCNLNVDPRYTRKDDLISGLSVTDTEMVHVLTMICRMNRLRWSVKDEMIVISDRDITEETDMKVYDIADLCVEPKSFEAGSFKKETVTIDPTTPEGRSIVIKTNERSTDERNRLGDEWVQIIRTTVDPWSWGDESDGRSENTISYRGGKLVVTHTAAVHEKIAKLLDAFRKARAVQVCIRTRFIDINKDFLERAGIDWTGLDNLITRGVNTIAGGRVPAGGSYQGSARLDEYGIPVTEAPWYRNDVPDPAVTPNAIGPVRGSPYEPPLDSAETFGRRPWPSTVDGATPDRVGGYLDLRGANVNYSPVQFPPALSAWNASGGMVFDIAFLTRYQLRALIEAVKKEKKGNILTSPRVTCFNGQRANIVVARLISYIQTYDEDATPVISSVTDGVVLEVKPYVSADQRYVTLELLPSITEIAAWNEIPITRNIVGAGNPVVGFGTIQLPDVATRSVETTVSVPDGGTILIGGLARATEQEGYASVPLLSKIPLVKYLFMSWGKLDTRENLVILVTADILIQSELEPIVAARD